MILTGTYQLPLDSQRRFTIPHRWREDGEKTSFYLLYRHDARDPHIILCPKESFNSLVKKIPDLAFMDFNNSKALLSLAHNMRECNCDKQGRINIAEDLKPKLQLNKEIVLVGAFNHAQIWHPSKWDSYKLGIESSSVSTHQILSLINND